MLLIRGRGFGTRSTGLRGTVMARTRNLTAAVAALTCAALITAGCSSGGGNGARGKSGPIRIWYSNNAQERGGGKATVAAWNKDHPDQQVPGEETPAGTSSEKVITAAIAAGN